MSEPPRERTLDEVGRLLAGQAKLRAIAHYREATGAGHADAKRAIERIQAGQPPADPRPALPPVSAEARAIGEAANAD